MGIAFLPFEVPKASLPPSSLAPEGIETPAARCLAGSHILMVPTCTPVINFGHFLLLTGLMLLQFDYQPSQKNLERWEENYLLTSKRPKAETAWGRFLSSDTAEHSRQAQEHQGQGKTATPPPAGLGPAETPSVHGAALPASAFLSVPTEVRNPGHSYSSSAFPVVTQHLVMEHRAAWARHSGPSQHRSWACPGRRRRVVRRQTSLLTTAPASYLGLWVRRETLPKRWKQTLDAYI